MKILDITKYYQSRSDIFWVFPLYDIHGGHVSCNEEKLKRTVSYIEKRKDRAITFLGGDLLDAHPRGHRFHGRDSHYAKWCRDTDDMCLAQELWLKSMLKPVKDTIEASVPGNHEESIMSKENHDIFMSFHERLLGSERASQVCNDTCIIINVTFRRGTEEKRQGAWTLSFFLEHGFGGGRKKGAKILNLHDKMGDFDCDVFMRGHVHSFIFTERVEVGNDGRQRTKLGIVQPSFLETYSLDKSSYGEPKSYSPGISGCIPLRIEPDKKRVTIEFSANMR